ncbi:MAG: efflux RND transporter periplasmic adaptor subunit [Pseudobdellovibrionaceae bacterium]|jgi:membrane fusion protein (multidrug efflux system)|nr:efflux RND transporter periplasmic adaptor subunit [Pseudobdellovibrionaceae bacterium]
MKKLIISGVVVALLVAAYFIYGAFGTEVNPANAAGPSAGPPKAVSVIQIAPQKIILKKELPGRITAYRQSQVRPQVDGLIVARLFEEGSNVTKGDQLYQIDDARYIAGLNSAKADLKAAEANIRSVRAQANRYKQLIEIEAVSKQEYDNIRADVDKASAAISVAKAAVDVAQVNLDYTKVYAPISGRIGRSFVTEGGLVTANQAQQLATITQLDPVYVDMQESGDEALHLRSRLTGVDEAPVTIIYGDASSKDSVYPYEGTLKFSEVTVDETTGSVTLRAEIPNKDYVLMPGLFVRAQINMGEKEVLLVPQRATLRGADGKLSLWVVDQDNKAQKRVIETEQAYDDQWVVTSGVETGDQVIVEGYQKIGVGQVVAPSPWVSADAAEQAVTSTK